MRATGWVGWLGCAAALHGCGGSSEVSVDGGVAEGGRGDAAALDGGPIDAGGGDDGSDGGGRVDAGSVDGSAGDGSSGDGATRPDGGAGADGGEGWPPLPACVDPLGMPGMELLSGEGTGVEYRLWRCYYAQGAGHTGVYRGDAFELVIDGEVFRATTGEIDYEWTHHNWYDRLEATTAAGIARWRVEFDIDTSDLSYFVSAERPDGTAWLAETEVDATSMWLR